MNYRQKFIDRFGTDIDEYTTDYRGAYEVLNLDGNVTWSYVLTKAADKGYLPIVMKYFNGNITDTLREEILYKLIKNNNTEGILAVANRMLDVAENMNGTVLLCYDDIHFEQLVASTTNKKIEDILTRLMNDEYYT